MSIAIDSPVDFRAFGRRSECVARAARPMKGRLLTTRRFAFVIRGLLERHLAVSLGASGTATRYRSEIAEYPPERRRHQAAVARPLGGHSQALRMKAAVDVTNARLAGRHRYISRQVDAVVASGPDLDHLSAHTYGAHTAKFMGRLLQVQIGQGWPDQLLAKRCRVRQLGRGHRPRVIPPEQHWRGVRLLVTGSFRASDPAVLAPEATKW